MASTRALNGLLRRELCSTRSSRRLLHHSSVRHAITKLEMPAMSPTMTEGGISSWKKREGESFSAGDVLLEIETDKATIDVEAQDDGVMGKILLQDGTKGIPVGKVIALLAEEGDDISNLEVPKEEKVAPKAEAAAPPPPPVAEPVKATPPTPAAQSLSSHSVSHSRPLFPSVHRLIHEFGIMKPEEIKGTGVRGMLTKGDVLAYLGKASTPTGTYKQVTHALPEVTQAVKKEEPKALDGPAIRRLIVSTMLQKSIAARNVTPASQPVVDFDSIISDYLPQTPASPPKAPSQPQAPKPSVDYLEAALRKPRHASTFGLESDSDESSSSENSSDSDYSSSDESIISSRSFDSFCYASESEVPKLPSKSQNDTRSLADRRKVEDTIAAIRLRTRHHDQYEDWQRQTRIDAFRTARQELNLDQQRFHDAQEKGRTVEMERRMNEHARQMQDMEAHFERLRLKAKQEEEVLIKEMKARQAKIWEGIEGVIKAEEEVVRARLAEEVKRKEEEERQREKKRLEEEAARKAKEEEEKKAEEERRKKKEKEEEDARLKAIKEREETDQHEIRRICGFTSPEADWTSNRSLLEAIKRDTMKSVKADKGAKSEWSKWRRAFTPKIGQLTSDASEITRISLDIYYIFNPRNNIPLHPAIYRALLYSLSKTILLQAETEVTAEKKSAQPIASVAFNLLETLQDFGQVFFTQLVKRAGGWPIPYLVPSGDYSGPDQAKAKATDRSRKLAMGYLENGENQLESLEVHTARISGIMRVFFNILKNTPRQQPLPHAFQLPRFWTWLTRLLMNKALLESPVAPQLIYTALDVMDIDGRKIWGHQYNKLLELIYEGVTKGYEADKLIGGTSPEAVSARARVKMTIERVLLEG
ncbi:hypothetical protein H0H92_011897 [Tricholoma furcatifolium]|nr:hypothetical protein H0H92_011897 [Tricholoma furcatifolium]